MAPTHHSLACAPHSARARVGRVVNGAFERGWLYKDSLNPIAQVNAAGVVEATYVYVTRANVPDYIVTTAGAVYRVVSDHLGSVRMLVNATTGAVVERYDYDVWGRVTFESGDHSLHPFGYAGGLYDADTGLVRFGVRDYDADAGRWTAPEPLGFAAEANWYRYANGDPMNYTDPTGLIAPIIWGLRCSSGWQSRHMTQANRPGTTAEVGRASTTHGQVSRA
ncbi:MAG: RHS repeat-associated core domain-containing protein [Sandaracinaceae bacterium]|nr:RHS repeat-associated core domain-containing protein [Sandaracinaceae bacterium]